MNEQHLDEIIGKNIKRQRKSRNMTRDELAEMLNLSSGSVSHMENGTRGATRVTLQKLSDIFGMRIGDFFTENEHEIFLSETKKNVPQIKRERINSLVFGLAESELDFVIEVIKSYRKQRYPNMEVDEE